LAGGSRGVTTRSLCCANKLRMIPNGCISLHPAGFPTPPHQAAGQGAGSAFVATILLPMVLGIVFRNYLSPVRLVLGNKRLFRKSFTSLEPASRAASPCPTRTRTGGELAKRSSSQPTRGDLSAGKRRETGDDIGRLG
jgi:hypothetical protein